VVYEIDADGRDVGFGVRVIRKSEEKTGLADTTVSYKEESAETESATYPGQRGTREGKGGRG